MFLELNRQNKIRNQAKLIFACQNLGAFHPQPGLVGCSFVAEIQLESLQLLQLSSLQADSTRIVFLTR